MQFPISESSPITYPGPPPAAADVVVIGGGVIGVSTALHLAQAGKKVVLCEKGRIAGEQSSRNWGWIREQGRDVHELPIMQEAARIWTEWAAQTNVDIGLRKVGVTYLADTKDALEKYQGWLDQVEGMGTTSRLLSREETAALAPGMSRSFVGALHTPTDMKAEPFVAVPALAGIAVREGAVLVENCAVRALDMQNGSISGVITESGRISCERVVVAGGAWSSLFLRAHGVNIPQLSVRLSACATQTLPDIGHTGTGSSAVAWRRREDGGYTLAQGGFHEFFIGPDAFRALPKFMTQIKEDLSSTRFLPSAPPGYPDSWFTPRRWNTDRPTPFEKIRVLNPRPNIKRLRRVADNFAALFPELGPVRIERAWAGMADTMPDVVPVVDQVAEVPGLIVGTGMSGHGFGIGPGMGRVLADLAQNNAPKHDLTRFRMSRFTDGSEMVLGPSI